MDHVYLSYSAENSDHACKMQKNKKNKNRAKSAKKYVWNYFA